MSAAAVAQYASNLVRYDPQAAQQARDAAAQAQAKQQLSIVQRDKTRTPAEQTLEGELLNKESQQQRQAPELSEEEYLARHQEQRARSSEGYQSPAQQAIASYQTTALLTHPADLDRVGIVDVYA